MKYNTNDGLCDVFIRLKIRPILQRDWKPYIVSPFSAAVGRSESVVCIVCFVTMKVMKINWFGTENKTI